jgi:ring-1,2-phenylacetyl-CoA epoxidase subunit PaaD
VSTQTVNRLTDFPSHIIRKQIASILEKVHDPEIPGVSIIDLGMVLDIRPENHHWHIDLAVTYSGCPAIDVIPFLAKAILAEEGFADATVEMIISPPWSTDWISERGNEKLVAWGIAPPNRKSVHHDFGQPKQCPQCGSTETSLISAYGSTPCKAMYRCDHCEETFDYFKCY